MTTLPIVFDELHKLIETRLTAARRAFAHPVAKGDASESAWLAIFNEYLPKRYRAEKAFAVDSDGRFSQHLDIVIFDRQYTPFIFTHEGQHVIPAESIYAVFEAKQTIDAGNINYAMEKVESARTLTRTSLTIPTANGPANAKEPHRILGGFLALDSDWKPALGDSLHKALMSTKCKAGQLDLGCIASHGIFTRIAEDRYQITPKGKPATTFLLELVSQLQSLATVPMVDIRAYAKWLDDTKLSIETP
jgi:hypothetical protein